MLIASDALMAGKVRMIRLETAVPYISYILAPHQFPRLLPGPSIRPCFDSGMRVTAPAREGRKEGAKNIKTYWHISRFTYGKLL